jgi:hypothetical protein
MKWFLSSPLNSQPSRRCWKDVNGINPGIDQIAQDEIHDPVLPAERDSGLGSLFGEWVETGAFPACEHEGKHSELHDSPVTRWLAVVSSSCGTRSGEWTGIADARASRAGA